MGQMLTLTAEDGFHLAAYRATPQGKPRGGLVVIQEIFGVNSHIKKVTDGFAADGYVALAPAIFDRAEPGFAVGYKQEDIELGRAVRAKIPIDDCVKDVRAAVQALRAEGLKVGVVGYCFGGTLAWLAATRIDGRLQLYVMERLLRLPMDYFETTPVGFTSGKIGKIWQIRGFLFGSGKGRSHRWTSMSSVGSPSFFQAEPFIYLRRRRQRGTRCRS